MSYHRTLSAAALLGATLLFVPSLTATTVITAGSTSTVAGQFFTLPVNIADTSDVYAFQFDLGFNPAVLQLMGISEGSFLPSAGTTIFVSGTIDNVAGTAIGTADTLVGNIPGASGNGDLVDFLFQAINVGISPITLSNGILLDSSSNDIPFTTADGSVTVSGFAVPEPAGLCWIGACALALLFWVTRRRPGVDTLF